MLLRASARDLVWFKESVHVAPLHDLSEPETCYPFPKHQWTRGCRGVTTSRDYVMNRQVSTEARVRHSSVFQG